MVKRKQKKVVKQKQKVNVKQNVKVVIGDIKRKRNVKSSGAKPGASAKPPIVLNISNPQPYNNPYMMFFKDQLKNQQPIQANTLTQHERINEREENKASRAGALNRIDQEPNDVAREMNRQADALQARIKQADEGKRAQAQEINQSLKSPPPTSGRKKKKTPKRKTRLVMEDDDPNFFSPLVEAQDETDEDQTENESSILNAIQQQQNAMEAAMMKAGSGAGAGAEGQEEAPAVEPSVSKQGGAGRKRGPIPSDLPTPTPQSTRESLLDTLSQYDERQLQRKLKGKKLNDYIKILGLRTHMRGATNPISAEDQRIAIIGLVYNYKRDQGMTN
jgi:hypothetical protein